MAVRNVAITNPHGTTRKDDAEVRSDSANDRAVIGRLWKLLMPMPDLQANSP
jgi:hypothetical protein